MGLFRKLGRPEYDKVQLLYSEPFWRGLVVFFWTVFPGGLGLIRTPRHPPFSRGARFVSFS